MPTATNMAQLEQMLKQSLENAISNAEGQLYLQAQKNNRHFYDQGRPKQYKRTGQLGNAIKTTGVTPTGKGFEAEIYEDMSYSYTTGTYSTPKIFAEAEHNGSGILGAPDYWRLTENSAQQILDEAMAREFG